MTLGPIAVTEDDSNARTMFIAGEGVDRPEVMEMLSHYFDDVKEDGRARTVTVRLRDPKTVEEVREIAVFCRGDALGK